MCHILLCLGFPELDTFSPAYWQSFTALDAVIWTVVLILYILSFFFSNIPPFAFLTHFLGYPKVFAFVDVSLTE